MSAYRDWPCSDEQEAAVAYQQRYHGPDGGVLDVARTVNVGRPDPDWVHLRRSYCGEFDAVEKIDMPLRDFRWLVANSRLGGR